ncbi:inactive protein RESTRICTED TEV MOVEMENT 2 [Pyrus ussuriensis x Pyrus communis]|uniref:Inactive protein RESTRICTED TEV MOVEMENT 2 n=1 Tax=Pyrus ussuriensis x Pyrus communis TaxID=2448454 RepID=A0A5N5GGX6_9ROSA|nr:inactive protein RESTRICTED TEV MOVEMENT 2 [Pyrus ussuriensis x Pyrus communis]
MVMRRGPIGGSSGTNTRPRQTNRPTYEDFQPRFELKEEQEAYIVLVHLPGFVKEQVRITIEHNPNVIRVHGQRPLGNNKSSRFNQTFPIQENCDVSKIDAKFNDGILTITIPKPVITQTAATKPVQEPPPKTAATAPKPMPQKVQEDPIPSKPSLTTPAAAASKAEKATFTARDEKEKDDKNGGRPLGPPKGTAAETKAQKDKEDAALPIPVSSTQNFKQRDEKRLLPLTSPETGIGMPKSQKHGHDGERGKASVESVSRKRVENRDQREADGKPDAEPKNAEKLNKITLHKETGERSKEARGLGKPKEDSVAANVMGGAKQHMKNLGNGMSDEEKQMLINMGAAVLVLLALGASASYNIWSSATGKN